MPAAVPSFGDCMLHFPLLTTRSPQHPAKIPGKLAIGGIRSLDFMLDPEFGVRKLRIHTFSSKICGFHWTLKLALNEIASGD